MSEGKVSPIYAIPCWFLTDILSVEAKDATRILWYFMHRHLAERANKIPASFKDIEEFTGISPQNVSLNIKRLMEKGYLIRVKVGTINTTTQKRTKAEYRVNWDFKEAGTKDRVYKTQDLINGKYDFAEMTIEETLAGVPKEVLNRIKQGDDVRRGRFGEEVEGEDNAKDGKAWAKIGFGSIRAEQSRGPLGIAMRKIRDGDFGALNPFDLLAYFSFKYSTCAGSSFICTSQARYRQIFTKLQLSVPSKDILLMIRYLFESGQTRWKLPTPGLLGSGWGNEILRLAKEWQASGCPKGTTQEE